ncbi:unnamed protein product [Tuber aestivum]|uniref:Uncharacterized protein n=1 Tax=Tuber aestivum TaxID=59557 RepID=A0A292Q094_9PEZI|nr:unnamed protein product [Tuber aestivum]
MSQADSKGGQVGMSINVLNMGMGVGGPAGINMNGGPGPRPAPTNNERSLLNTYIYDYFLKNDMIESARSLFNEGEVLTLPNDGSRRPSPARRAQKHDPDGSIVNGIDDNPMDTGEGSQRKTEDGEDGTKRGDDLPRPKVPSDCPHSSFLFDWWCIFSDIFGARNGGVKNPHAAAYVAQTQVRLITHPMRQMAPHQQQLISGQVPSQMYAGRIMPGGMMVSNGMHVPDNTAGMDINHKNQLVRQAMLNSNRKLTPQQINAMKNQQMMQQAMQRTEGDVSEMNGQQPRPQSPATAQNAGSPGTKRIRLDNGEYQQVGNGRGAPQGVPPGSSGSASQAHQMLLAGGINPSQLTPQQFAAFQGQNPITQHKSIQLYAQNLAAHTGRAVSALKQQGGPASTGMPNMPQNQQGHGSPMMPQTTEGAALGVSDFYATTPGGGAMRGGINPGSGNHALQDYQMQLMMLEQQNKKRLMMARAEQDNIAHHGDGQRRMEPGFPQSMSPGSRAAPSPQPQGGPKMVGTPKMQNQGGPASPLPEGQISGQVPQRNSPAAMGAFNSQIPQEAHQNMIYPQMKDSMGMMGSTQGGGAPNGTMMRPPNSHPGFNGQMSQGDISQMRAQQAGRGGPSQMVGPGWQTQQQQQMQMHQTVQQQQQQQQPQQPGGQQPGQPPQVGTPQQARQNLPHQAMPPPSAPAGAPGSGRTQPSSPQVQNQQPATPTQSHKPAPKTKGGRDPGKKQRPTKKNASAAAQAPNPVTPSSEPPTPTTPQHASSFAPGAAHQRPANFVPGAPQGGNGAGQPQQNAPNPAPAAPPAPITAQDPTTANAFSDLPADLGLDGFEAFPNGPNDSLLDNFDFDSFLNTEDNQGMAAFDGLSGQWNDGVEAGAGDS